MRPSEKERTLELFVFGLKEKQINHRAQVTTQMQGHFLINQKVKAVKPELSMCLCFTVKENVATAQ